MGHKSYVNPTLDEDNVASATSRPVRRKGSDLPDDDHPNERSPLTSGREDRKKDRPLPWTKHQSVRRAMMAVAVIVGVAILLAVSTGAFLSNDVSKPLLTTSPRMTTPPTEATDVVDGVPDVHEGGHELAQGGNMDNVLLLPTIVAPYIPHDVDQDLSLSQLLALWQLPQDAIDLMTYREWSDLHTYIAAAAANFGAQHGHIENKLSTEGKDSNLLANDASATLIVFHRILGEIQLKLDAMQQQLIAADEGATDGTNQPSVENEPPIAHPTTPPVPISTGTTAAVAPTTPIPTTTAPIPTATTTLPPTSSTTPPPTTTTTPPPTTTSPPAVTLPLATSAAVHPPVPSLDYQKGLALWLQADKGVEFVGSCGPESSQCYVKQWKNSAAATSSSSSFYPANLANPTTFPVWLPGVRNGLPTLHMTCPMVYSNGVLLRDGMTLFFVLSPAHLSDDPTDSKLQKFFGHAPYGQLRFQARKAGYGGTSAVVAEDNHGIGQGEFAVLTYRMDKQVSIQVNGMGFGSESPIIVQSNNGGGIAISATEATTLGNVKSFCDAHAFHGRMAEVLVFDNVLSDNAIDAVHLYLHQKWAIPKGPCLPKQQPASYSTC
ncbi:hypothetical protein, variant [Aphanomyces astaci]|uniref:Uncharacterized protein n=1 Tax=Aphanomyces astaci TaxID=112090 RepID=W4FFJ4_APHAT|nr:hypothetical protein, variant [Aphanomyces astaci]ETV66287.1 hypothetical protein, variant [Aphanomyces astaci]|eukprot:XP_009844273.1 hypothetical protein, variant [Aphanomyces astaci]